MAKTNHTTIKQTNITTTVDYDTGEVRQQEIDQTMQWKSEPNYIKIYTDDICYLSDIPQSCSKVLRELLKYVSYADKHSESGGMIISLSPYTRQQIMENVGFKYVQSLSSAISQLVNGGVLFKLGVGAYRLNPNLFGKGNWSDIVKLRLIVDYDLEKQGKTFMATITRQKGKESQHKSTIHRAPIKLSPEEKRLLEIMM